MKKLSLLILAAALAGCGPRSSEPADPGKPPVEDPKPPPVDKPTATAPPRKPASDWVKALVSPDQKTRAEAGEALRTSGDDTVPVDEAIPVGEAVSALKEALKDANPRLRLQAAEILGEMGGKAGDAATALCDALQDKDEAVREQVIGALTLILTGPDDKAVTALVAVLEEPAIPARLRAETAWALGHMGADARAAVPALTAALKDGNNTVRLEAIMALGHVGPDAKEAVPALAEFLKDKNEEVRREAATSLGTVGLPALPTLIEALKLPDPVVRKRALEGIGEMAAEAEPATEAVSAALKDEDPGVRQEATRVLKKINPEAAAKAGIR